LGYSDKTHRRCRKSVAAELGEERRIERRIGRKPSVDVVLDPMVPPDFVEEFEDDAGTEPMQPCDMPLSTKALLRLRAKGVLL
jgi:hypothetical protein